MIGLLLVYFIGKAFYDLALKFNQNKWGFAVLGILSYYLGLLLGGGLIGICMELFSPGSVEEFPDMVLGLMCIPLGALACWGVYKFLERKWSRPAETKSHNVLDDNL